MAQGKSQFTSAAGQYYVAYGLAVREMNVAITLGNAPNVDLLVSSGDGRRSIALQVKTAQSAYRHRRYGTEGYEWHVGSNVIGNHAERFWYAFVDLQAGDNRWDPRVFFVPSRWVAEFVKPDWNPSFYFLPTTARELTMERWDIVRGYVSGDEGAIQWAKAWPKELLCEWGSESAQAAAPSG